MIWRNIVNVFYEDRSIFVKKAGIKVLSLLLSTSANYDSNTGMKILQTVFEPLIVNNILFVESLCTSDNNFPCQKTSSESDNKFYNGETVTVSRKLINAAKCLCDILQDLLPKDVCLPGNLTLVVRVSDDITETVITSDILRSCISVQDCQTFALLLLMVELSNVNTQHYNGLDKNPCRFSPVYSQVAGIIRALVDQGYCCFVTNFCVTCLSWRAKSKYSKDCYDSSCEACSEFESTILYYLRIFLHINNYCFSCCGSDACLNHSKFRKYFTDKLSTAEILFEQLTADCVSEQVHTQKVAFLHIQSGVLALSRSLDFILNHANMGMILTDALATLRTMTRLLSSHEDLIKSVLLHLLTLTRNLIEKSPQSFLEKMEANYDSIFPQTMGIIDINCIDDIRVTVAALQTLNVILKNFLMLDFMRNIELRNVRPDFRDYFFKLALKLSCINWEVRDTALEVLQTMIEVGEIVPWFFMEQSMNLKQLLDTILKVVSSDESPYVRASALNFCTRIVRAKLLDDVSPQVLSELGMKTLLEDNVPATRRAACDLLTALNITGKPHSMDSDVTSKMYEAVFRASTKDFDWEVKTAALMFWHSTIDKHLMEGKVPMSPSALQFSKSNRSKEQTCLQIVAIFKTLGEIGCLQAIWQCLNDESDLQVALEAYEIVKYFEVMDKQWNFINCITKENNCCDETEPEPSCQKLESYKFFNLLRKQDWNERLKSRKNWISSKVDDLTSLMDLILNVDNRINDWDHNILDCY